MPDNTQRAAKALIASADAAGLTPVVPEDERLLARVVLVVDVVKGFVPERSTSNGYEYPYEYVCVRGATALGATAHGPTGILSVLDEGFFEDPDPDGALVDAVRDGLAMLAPTTATEVTT